MSYVAMWMLLAFSLLNETECKQCSAGELKNGNGTCTPCPPGTFMHLTNHILSSCYDCEKKKPNISVHHECNATHNTGCPIGSFQSEPYPQVCQQCTAFKFYEAEPCASESDAIFCDYENMMLVKTINDSVTCVYPSTHVQYCCEFQLQATSTRDTQDTIMAATTEKMQEETTSADPHQSTDHYPINKTDPAYPQSGLDDGARIAVSIVIGVLFPVFGILSYFLFLKIYNFIH